MTVKSRIWRGLTTASGMDKGPRRVPVYILGSISGVPHRYIGVTNDLERRLSEHKSGLFEGFTKKYRVNQLLWYERYDRIEDAIGREKQMKNWRRDTKQQLIERENPD